MELRAELERAGHVVVPHGDSICVRLPMFASVRARVEDGQLRLEAQLGPFRRTRAVLLTLLGATGAGIAGFLSLGVEPAAFAIAIGAIGTMFGEVSRLVLTESCMTRMQLAWSATSPARLEGDATARAVLPPPTLSRSIS